MEDEIYALEMEPIATAHSGIHHYCLTTIISKRQWNKYHASKFLEHCQAALQVSASLKEFSNLSDAEETTHFDVVRQEMKQTIGGQTSQTASAAASHPLVQSTVSKHSVPKRKPHSLPVFALPINDPTFMVTSSDVVSSTSMASTSSAQPVIFSTSQKEEYIIVHMYLYVSTSMN